jgi:hypothetical protein
MKLRNFFLTAFLLFPVLAFSGIAGKYHVKLINIAGNEIRLHARIEKVGDDVYNVRWVWPDGTSNLGTAVRHGNHLSVVFYSSQQFGTELFEIEDHNTLKGIYTLFGGTGVGYEQWKKIERKETAS